MSDSLRISAVIPAYNAEPFLRRSIDSAMAQTFKPLEIIIIDDGSTDGTAEIAKSYGDAVSYVYQENAGASAARNTGISASQGDWIAFLDVDDEWRPHHLENAVNILENHPELKWYGAPVNQYIQETGKLIAEYVKKEPGILIDNAYFEDYMVAFPPYAHLSPQTMVIHKSVFEKVGKFDPKRQVGCDIDMWYRIGLHFPKVGYCHEVAANIYRRSTSLSYTTIKLFKKSLERIREHEVLAENLGADARQRAEPRIMYWVTKLLKASISKGDYPAVREIFDIYKKRLSPRWRWLASIFLLTPWAVGLLFTMRNTISTKQRSFQAHGLR